MAKKVKAPVNSEPVEKQWRVTPIAKKLGIAPQTLSSATKRGEIPLRFSACGLPFVLEADVRKWMKGKNRGKVGRPAFEKK